MLQKSILACFDSLGIKNLIDDMNFYIVDLKE